MKIKNNVFFDKLKTEVVLNTNIEINSISLNSMIKEAQVDWYHPKINQYSSTKHLLSNGNWNIQILKPNKSAYFKDLLKLSKEDEYTGANIFHLLQLVIDNKIPPTINSILSPASLYVDDFGKLGCVVLNIHKNKIKIGVGNWRGHRIKGYYVARIKKI